MSENENSTEAKESSLAEQLAQADVKVSQSHSSSSEQAAGDKESEARALGQKVSLAKKLMAKDGPVQKKRDKKLGGIFIGRRKTSLARVKMVKGDGQVKINKRDLSVYFPKKAQQEMALSPLIILEKRNDYNLLINVQGGGISGQAEAISLAIARCLDTESDAHHSKLREANLLTRDSRMVERKKYGLHKARRAPQFSKR